MLNQMLRVILFSLIALSVACTSSQKAAEYPKRYIDQPYTLPDDVNVWGAIGTAYYERSRGQDYTWPYPVPIPLYWEHSISDDLTLEIPILPIGLRWRISSNENSEMGLHASWGFGYGSSSGLSLYPSLSLYYKKFQDRDHAFIIVPTLSYSYFARELDRSYFNVTLPIGYLIQLNDAHAIQPRIIAAYSDSNKRVILPLEFFYTYRMAETWQFESTYRYSGIGHNDYFGHFLTLIFKKYF